MMQPQQQQHRMQQHMQQNIITKMPRPPVKTVNVSTNVQQTSRVVRPIPYLS